MKLEGTSTIPAPRETVYKQLLNPEVLARSMPGCEKLDPQPDGSYHAQLKVGIAAAKGVYQGRIEILDAVPPERFRLKVDGQGSGGFLKGEAMLTLTETEGTTTIRYSGDAQVGGLIASVGQRLIQGAAKQVVNQFFEAFAKQIRA